MRQSIVALFTMMISSTSFAQEHVRGWLIWSADMQTLTVCDTEEVYWVRVLAANPFHLLSVKVEELSRPNGGEIVAEFRGDIIPGKPSAGPTYFVDGTLMVSEMISVAHGEC